MLLAGGISQVFSWVSNIWLQQCGQFPKIHNELFKNTFLNKLSFRCKLAMQTSILGTFECIFIKWIKTLSSLSLSSTNPKFLFTGEREIQKGNPRIRAILIACLLLESPLLKQSIRTLNPASYACLVCWGFRSRRNSSMCIFNDWISI